MPSFPRPRRQSAFTLIELLTVIVIIAILMALLFPAINAAKEGARKAQAKQEVMNIVNAVKSYYTEYGKFPSVTATGAPAPGANDPDAMVGDSAAGIQNADNNLLFNTLRSLDADPNKNYDLNPRRVVFYDGRSVTNSAQPRAGFLDNLKNGGDAAKQGSLFDPWGKEYCIVIDTDYDNKITVDDMYKDFAKPNEPRVQVGAFSVGRDLQLGTKDDKMYKNGSTASDDVVSWQ